MFGKRKSTVKTTKVRPKSEEEEPPGEIHLSSSISSGVPNSMQQVQAPVDYFQNVVTEQNENCELAGGDSPKRKQPSFDPVEVKVHIGTGEIGAAETSSSSGSYRIADGENTRHAYNDRSARHAEAIREFVKSVGWAKGATTSTGTSTCESLETEGHIRVQSSLTPDYCHVKQSASKQGALEDTMQMLRCGVLGSADEFQSQGSVFTKLSLDGSRNVEQVNADATSVTIPRTNSTASRDSYGDCCRICQQPTDEALVELGCKCRGDLAKAHLSCMQAWFTTKGSNKCEICQHVASNVPAPPSQPAQHFWVWRGNGPYRGYDGWLRRQGEIRFHPLWAALLILVAGLLFDILISIFLGASALPVNIIIGILVVLGLGTAVRLLLECWHERNIRRNLQGMETDVNLEHHQERPPLQISV